jgi:hypothetical protein
MSVKGNVFPAHAIEVHTGNTRTALHNLDIDISESWVVNFTSRPLSRLEATPVPIEWEAGRNPEPV